MGVDGIQREKVGLGQGNDIRAGVGHQAAESLVLGLGGSEVGRMVKSERSPGGRFVGTIPSRVAGRADEDAQQIGGHGLPNFCLANSCRSGRQLFIHGIECLPKLW